MESNLVCVNVAILPVCKQHDIAYEISERVSYRKKNWQLLLIDKNECSYLDDAKFTMSSGNFLAPIYQNLLFAMCRAFRAFRAHHHLYNLMISLVLQTDCSYLENALNRNNYSFIKIFRQIMNF